MYFTESQRLTEQIPEMVNPVMIMTISWSKINLIKIKMIMELLAMLSVMMMMVKMGIPRLLLL